jgi:hypothetical protein
MRSSAILLLLLLELVASAKVSRRQDVKLEIF